MDNMKQEQGICPVCGNENLEYSFMEIGDESVSYPWICNKCGSNGYEVYNLQFVEHDKVCVNSKKKKKQKTKEK